MTPQIQLDPYEARVLGVLIEKALTTPDQYPLSLNAATVGANQKTNREPVLSLADEEVAGALTRMESKYLVRRVFLANSRVERYVHNAKDALNIEGADSALLAELLLRGPQTPGELRARASRMVVFDSLDAVMSALARLGGRELVRRLAPAPGTRAERYVQLLSPDAHALDAPAPAYAAAPERTPVPADLEPRLAALEAALERLERKVQELTARLEN